VILTSPDTHRKTDHIAEETHTWMQDSIKVAFVYTEPFWRNKNYSGTLFSNVGPITEFYDQSNAELTKFALCGFISMNDVLSKERLEKTQLEKIWSGSHPTSYHETVCPKKTNQKFQANCFMYPHQNNGHPYLESHLTIAYFAGTETANQYPGYMEGAIIAAENTVKAIFYNNLF
jgi:monoamine oxidase